MLTLRNLTLTLPNSRVLFSNLNAQAHPGQRICITGPNGVGKSTLLKTIAGFFQHQAGNIFVDGIDISKFGPAQRANRIGFMVQHPHHGCIPSLTVKENIILAAHQNSMAGLITPNQNRLLVELAPHATQLGINLAQVWEQPMNTLSGGQQQLIVFLITTMHCPPILLLDEPTAALSAAASECLSATLQKLSTEKKVTILCITHDQQFAKQIQTDEWHIVSQAKAPASFDFSSKTGHSFQPCSSRQ